MESLEWTTAHATRRFLGTAVSDGIHVTPLFLEIVWSQRHVQVLRSVTTIFFDPSAFDRRAQRTSLALSAFAPFDATSDSLSTMNPILVTFLVVIGAGAAVLLGYAMSYLFLSKAGMSEHDKVRLEVAAGQGFSQPVYMAQVRDRNLRDMMPRMR